MKKQIAIVTVTHPADDVRICHKEALFLAQNGWDVTILAPSVEKPFCDGIKFVSIPGSKNRLDGLCFLRTRILEAIEKIGARTLILHDTELMTLIPLLRNMGYKVIFDVRNESLSLPGAIALKALQRRFLPAADGVIAATGPIANRLSLIGLSPVLVRNRLTKAEISFIEHALLNEKAMKNTVCYAGLISKRCGAERVVKACFEANATLLLAGRFESDTFRSELESMHEYICVKYEGVLDRCGIASLLARSQAGLLLPYDTPCHRESEPIKLFEYLAAGLPVIASDFDYWRTLGAGNRICFAKSDDEAARLIRKTLDDTALLGQIHFHRDAMQRKFCFDRDGDNLLRLCERVSGNDIRPLPPNDIYYTEISKEYDNAKRR